MTRILTHISLPALTKKTLFVALLTAFFCMLLSCSKNVADSGTLTFNINSSNPTIDQQVKSLSNDELGAFTVSIPGSNFTSDTYQNIKGKDFIFLEGTYTANAESCSNEISQSSNNNYGCIRYAGEQPFTVSAGAKSSVTINCIATNAKISVLLNPDFLSVFDISATSVTISTSTDGTVRPLDFKFFSVLGDSNGSAVAMTDNSQTAARYAYYLPNSQLYLTVTTKKTGGTEVVTYPLPLQSITTLAKSWHKITLGAITNSTSGGIEIKIGENITSVNNGFSIDGYTPGTVTED